MAEVAPSKIRIEVTLTVARWGDDPFFGGFIALCDAGAGTEARFEFGAQVETEGEDVTCIFTRLRRPSHREDFSALGPFSDEVHVLFATALSAAVTKAGEHLLKRRFAEGRALVDGPRERFPVKPDDLGITVRIPFEPSSEDSSKMIASLIYPGPWGLFGEPKIDAA